MAIGIYDLEPLFGNARHFWLSYDVAASADGDLTLFRSSVAHPSLNGVLRLRDGDLDTAIAFAYERLASLPWTWRVGQDSRRDVAQDLIQRGATYGGCLPVMAVDLRRFAELEGPAELQVTEVQHADLEGWARACSPSFGVEPHQLDEVTRLERRRMERLPSLIRFAGRIDGEVVGTSVLLDACGVAGVYAVSTAERYRSRGIGAQMTAAALRAGRERGLRVATLQSTSAGFSLYARMGFESVAEYRLFSFK